MTGVQTCALPILFNRAGALDQAGRLSEAVRAYRAYLDAAPPDDGSRRERAEERLRALAPGGRAGGGQAEDVAPGITSEAAVLTAAECEKCGAMAFAQRQFDKALTWYEHSLAKDPRSQASWAGKGESLRGLGRPDEALGAYDEALARDPRDVTSWLNKASALDSLTRHEESVACCDRALEIAPAHLPALNVGGLALLALGRLENALRAFDHALAIDPHFALARFNKACVEELLGRPADAVRSFQQFLAIAPPVFANQIQHARARQQALEGP